MLCCVFLFIQNPNENKRAAKKRKTFYCAHRSRHVVKNKYFFGKKTSTQSSHPYFCYRRSKFMKYIFFLCWWYCLMLLIFKKQSSCQAFFIVLSTKSSFSFYICLNMSDVTNDWSLFVIQSINKTQKGVSSPQIQHRMTQNHRQTTQQGLSCAINGEPSYSEKIPFRFTYLDVWIKQVNYFYYTGKTVCLKYKDIT